MGPKSKHLVFSINTWGIGHHETAPFISIQTHSSYDSYGAYDIRRFLQCGFERLGLETFQVLFVRIPKLLSRFSGRHLAWGLASPRLNLSSAVPAWGPLPSLQSCGVVWHVVPQYHDVFEQVFQLAFFVHHSLTICTAASFSLQRSVKASTIQKES